MQTLRHLTFAELRAVNASRQKTWCGDNLPDLSFRGNELAGEVGETIDAGLDFLGLLAAMGAAAGRVSNTIKKLERERLGYAGSRTTKEALARELGDLVLCADLVGFAAEIDLADGVAASFNATSEKMGMPQRISEIDAPSNPNQPILDALSDLALAARTFEHGIPASWHDDATTNLRDALVQAETAMAITPSQPTALDAAKAANLDAMGQLWDVVAEHVTELEVSCPEATTGDKVYEKAPEFLESVAEIVGYFKRDDEDDDAEDDE